MSSTKTAPKPTPSNPLYPYGDMLADSDGRLYDPNGHAVIIDGRHATTHALEAEADAYEQGIFRRPPSGAGSVEAAS